MKRHPAAHPGILPAILATASVLLSTSGCLSSPQLTGVIHEGTRGVVYLEEIPDLDFEASHPRPVDTATMARLLDRVRVQPNSQDSSARVGTPAGNLKVFSPEEVQFLAPLLSQALAAARPEHQIAFRTVRSTESKPEVTAGTLYAHKAALYLTLTHLQYNPPELDRAIKAKRSLPFSSKLSRYTMQFDPASVGQAAQKLPPGAPEIPTLTTLAINLEALGQVKDREPARTVAKQAPPKPAPMPVQEELAAYTLPVAQPVNGAAPPDSYQVKLQELQQANRMLGEKMAEQRLLMEDLEILKRKLAQQQQLLRQLRAQKKPAKSRTR